MFLCFSTISALDLLPVLSGSCSTLEVGFRKVSNFEKKFKCYSNYLTLQFTGMQSFTVYLVIVYYMYFKLFVVRRNKTQIKKVYRFTSFLLLMATCSGFCLRKLHIWFNDNHSWNSLVGPSMWRQHRDCGTTIDPLS